MRFYSNTYKTIICSLGLLVGSASFAQNQTYSPYSRFGIGEVNGATSSFQKLSLGSDIAFTSPQFLNFTNKASLPSLQSPVFDVSFAYNSTQLKNAEGTQGLSSGAIGGLILALPMNKGFAASLAITPVSSVGYKSTSTLVQDSIEGKVINEGFGGINDAQGTIAYNFLEGQDSSYFGLSVTAAYTFGSINRDRSIEFDDTYFKNTRNSTSLSVSDVRFEFGALYSTYLSEKSKICVGIVYTPTSVMNRSYNDLTQHYTTNSVGTESFKDTVSYISEKEGKITLPSSLNIGLSYTLNNQLTLSASMKNSKWSEYSQTIDGVETNLGNTDLTEFAFGVRLKPSVKRTMNESVLKQSTISLGAKLSNGYVSVAGEDVASKAVSLGVSMPLRRSNSNTFFHLGTEFGSRGEKDLIQENYVKVFFGLSISPKSVDKWFYKRKYN
tara:strand:- start:360822 stop:362141 length:1320 start_codon:yes stop_codon:yes gene_type:complete